MRFYQNLLIVFLYLLTSGLWAQDKTAPTEGKIVAMEEFVKHNDDKSCWILMDKFVYDVTKFLNDHPGSSKVLLKCCGKDCTKGYADKGIGEAHSKKADEIRNKMLVGILKEKQ